MEEIGCRIAVTPPERYRGAVVVCYFLQVIYSTTQPQTNLSYFLRYFTFVSALWLVQLETKNIKTGEKIKIASEL
jgi:hypothetical protein